MPLLLKFNGDIDMEEWQSEITAGKKMFYKYRYRLQVMDKKYRQPFFTLLLDLNLVVFMDGKQFNIFHMTDILNYKR